MPSAKPSENTNQKFNLNRIKSSPSDSWVLFLWLILWEHFLSFWWQDVVVVALPIITVVGVGGWLKAEVVDFKPVQRVAWRNLLVLFGFWSSRNETHSKRIRRRYRRSTPWTKGMHSRAWSTHWFCAMFSASSWPSSMHCSALATPPNDGPVAIRAGKWPSSPFSSWPSPPLATAGRNITKDTCSLSTVSLTGSGLVRVSKER